MLSRLFWFCFKAGFLIFTIIGFIGLYLVFYYSRDLPDYSQLAKYHPPLVTRVYSADGKLLEEYAKENRIFVPIVSVPKYVTNAFIAAEDKNFYHHAGIDFIGIIRAGIANINNILRGKRLEGASTITQQVVKNFLVGSERSIARKVKEAVLSYMISKTFTKEQILELYLNQTFFGKGAYGLASAAQAYFNKSVEELTIAEAAYLAGIPKAPSSYNPERNYNRAKERRDYVIGRMFEDGYIEATVAQDSIKAPITLIKRDKNNTVTAGYLAEQVRNIVTDMYGSEEFYTAGLNIYTTIDSNLQKEAEKALIEGIRNFDHTKGFRKPVANIDTANWQQNLLKIEPPLNLKDFKLAVVLNLTDSNAQIGLKDGSVGNIPLAEMKWARTNLTSAKKLLKKGDVICVEAKGKFYTLQQIPEINGGMMVMEPHTGKVLAHVGGYDYNANKFDRVTQAQRQPGSLIKSFVYLAALEQDIAPNTIYNDSSIELSQGPGMPTWKPKNYKGDFLGPITLRAGLEKSRNLITVRVAQHVGIAKVVELINRFGVNTTRLPLYYSVVLGALETTLERMTNAYAMIVNGGELITPQYIEMIQDRNGKIIYRRDDRVCHGCEVSNISSSTPLPVIEDKPKTKIVDEASAYQIRSFLLGAVERGTGARLKKLGKIIGGKTGSTNDSRDAWFMGFTSDMVVGSYIGYDTPRTLGKTATGATVALPVVEKFFEATIKDKPVIPFKIPETIKLVRIDPKTGYPSEGAGSIIEAFKVNEQTDIAEPQKYDNNQGIEAKDVFDSMMPAQDKEDFWNNIGEVY